MNNLRDRVERLERLLDDHLKRNPPKIDIDSLTDEERQALINFGALVREIRDNPTGHLIRTVTLTGTVPPVLGIAFNPANGLSFIADLGNGSVFK